MYLFIFKLTKNKLIKTLDGGGKDDTLRASKFLEEI